MSRIVVFEVPDKSDVNMRDMLIKLKELDASIEARVTMPFSHWVEMIKKEGVTGYPLFIPKTTNITDLLEWIEAHRTMPVENRNVYLRKYLTDSITEEQMRELTSSNP